MKTNFLYARNLSLANYLFYVNCLAFKNYYRLLLLVPDATDDLGDEKWMIVEQVCVAAMDTNRIDILDICLKVGC